MAQKNTKDGSTEIPVEVKRLEEDKKNITPWKKWGPYLSERKQEAFTKKANAEF